jgi:hypothetical protein
MPWVQREDGVFWSDDDNRADPSQQYITTYTNDEFGNYFPQQVENPNYDVQRYDPEEYQRRVDYAATQRGGGGLAGFLSRGPLKTAVDAISKPVGRFANALNTPEGMVAMVALMAGLPYFPGMTEAGLTAAAEAAGITSAELAALQAQAAAEIASGGIAGGASGSIASANAAAAGISSAELAALQAQAANEIATGGVSGGASGMTPGGTNALAPTASAGTNALAQAAQAAAPAAASAAGGMSNFLGPALGAAAQIAGGAAANNAITDAAKTAAASADKNIAFQQGLFDTMRADQKPWLDAGKTALGKLGPLMDYKKFSMNDFKADPGYQFRVDEGTRGVENSATARGMTLSGGALKGIERFRQGLASQAYGDAFDRYQTEYNQATRVPLAVAGFGQTATNNMQQGAQNFGNTAGTIMGNAGNTQANAQLARGSVYADTGNELMKMLTRYKV